MTEEVQAGTQPEQESVSEPRAQPQPSAEPSLPSEPAKSPREALERAFAETEPQDGNKPQGDRARDPATGKFVKTDGQQQGPTSAAETPVKPVDVPEWLAEEFKELWPTIPENFRKEHERLYRRPSEIEAGIAEHKTAREAAEAIAGPIQQYHDMAIKSGTTLDKALEQYVGIEQRLHQDPINGILQICSNLGVSPHAVGQALMGVQPTSGSSDSIEAATLNRRIAELEKQLNGKFGELENERKMKQAEEMISSFAKDHPYFDDVADVIAPMIERGYELSDAYELAVRKNPEIVAKIEADKAAKAAPPKPDPDQTRKANLSISGSPAPGSNPSAAPPADSPRDALTRAFASLGL